MSEKNLPIKIQAMQLDDVRYYHLVSNHIHKDTMEMYEMRISFIVDNSKILKQIDKNVEATNSFMDMLTQIQEKTLELNNNPIFQMAIHLDVSKIKEDGFKINPKVEILTKISKDYDQKAYSVQFTDSAYGIPIHNNTFNQLPDEVVDKIKEHSIMTKWERRKEK
tara:strand:+ start:235 stop:729 length:495 start_codon:yes stop_codon:yes gene_type:complete